MAQIDVSELMVDPDFVDEMTLVTRVPNINLYGESSTQDTSLESVGSIQPASAKTLQRLPEALRLENVSSFWFRGIITASSLGKYPSVLVFKGNRYQVRQVVDWSNFGQGYTEGICVAEKPS